jgi:hypothetical protein
MEFPLRTITSTYFWHMAQYCKTDGSLPCRVSPRSTREQRAHYLVHQLHSKTKLSKHTTHQPLINVLHCRCPSRSRHLCQRHCLWCRHCFRCHRRYAASRESRPRDTGITCLLASARRVRTNLPTVAFLANERRIVICFDRLALSSKVNLHARFASGTDDHGHRNK